MIGMLLCIHPFYANAVTLKAAMDAAVEQHPMLKISKMQVDGAQGELQEQGSYAYNPELSVEPQRRRLNGGGSSNDYYVTLSQGIELGGKQKYRELSAQAGLEAVRLESDSMYQQVSTNAARAFVELHFSKRELVWRNQQAGTLLQLHKAIFRQMELGEANQLDVNLSQASLTQAINAEAQAKKQHAMNVSRYVMAVGAGGEIKEIQPELPKLLVGWQPLSDPVDIAMNSRPDITAKRQRLAQHTAQADLANAKRIPDVTVGLMAGREAGDQLISLGFTMPIPVLNSHSGAYRAALSQASAYKTELEWFEQRVKLEVQEALFSHTTAMQSLLALSKVEGKPSSPDNIELARMAFDAGELNIEELVVHINQILESRINSAAIVKQGWLARIRLAEVLGHPEYILQGIKE
ncbi:Outer membrane protein TolC [Mariprofundus aestuarium]|uniref:Outer membrane protein TolC n=2 Tax=Mariprofundus aestuarium TaxID=1921086 RepID=A0A2K8KZD2_MARES|nr:Outer membrane protein TolC [Mariprofundus aestuarium]